MGRQVSADDTPAIYNYTGPNSTTQMPNNNQGIEFSTRLMVNGKLGPYPLMNFSQKSSAIVDADRTTSISIEVIINNTTDKDFGRVGYGVLCHGGLIQALKLSLPSRLSLRHKMV